MAIKGLSESTNGKPILIIDSASPGQIIHRASQSINIEMPYIYALNSNAFGVATITLEWGGTEASNRISMHVDPRAGSILLSDGFPINNGTIIRAYSDTSNVSVLGVVDY